MTSRSIEGHEDCCPARLVCHTLEAAAGFYAWRERPPSFQEQRRDAPLGLIRGVHARVEHRYGSRRIHAEPRAGDRGCSVDTVAEPMRDNGIRAKTARESRRTTDSSHRLPVADDVLDRRFDPEAPDEKWVAGITYIPTHEGFPYLAVVEDLYSRRVVGRSMAGHAGSRLVVDAPEVAVRNRPPGEGRLAHSDRGSRYASEHYQFLPGRRGIACGTSRRADCWGDAPMGSLFAGPKEEPAHDATQGR